MGVEYSHYLLPRRPSFRPSAERIARFAGLLRAEGWILGPGDAAFTKMVSGFNFGPRATYGRARRTGASFRARGESGSAPFPLEPEWLRARKAMLELSWPIEGALEIGARYPLSPWPYVREGVSFELQLRWSRYLLPLLGSYTTSPDARACACGAAPQPARDEPFFGALSSQCRACGAPRDLSRLALTVDDSGERVRVDGGGYHRFAVVIECGGCIPEQSRAIRVDPQLAQLASRCFGCELVELGLVH